MTPLNLFGLALQFLTRLPVPWEVTWSEEAQSAAARFYPAVGIVIGLLAALTFWLTSLIFPPLLAAFLTLAATILITGGLHEDGLADTADGLGSGAPRDRAMEIMRDSMIGAYGVLALITAVALKAAALASLPFWTAIAGLIAAHGISRYVCVWVIHRHSYARSAGAKFATPGIDTGGHNVAALTAAALAVLLIIGIGAGALIALAFAALAVFALLRLVLGRLQGYTGDTLGALQQVSEIAFLLGLAAWA